MLFIFSGFSDRNTAHFGKSGKVEFSKDGKGGSITKMKRPKKSKHQNIIDGSLHEYTWNEELPTMNSNYNLGFDSFSNSSNFRHSKKKCTLLKQQDMVNYYSNPKCTWKEKLPTMNSSQYQILYGIAPSICNFTVEQIKQEYRKNAIQLFIDSNYIKKQGKALQNKSDISDKEFSYPRDYIGIVVTQNCSILDTSLIADIIQENFNKHKIKNLRDEKAFITDYCKTNKFSAFSFPAQYKEIDKCIYTKRIIKPTCFYIVDTNIIVDVAIGINNIQAMITKYNNIR